MSSSSRGCLAGVLASLLLAPLGAFAQDSSSAGVAEELTRLLDERKLDSVAAHEVDDLFVAALYVPGNQLLVIGARSTPERPEYLIAAGQYRDVYTELSAMRDPTGKIFVMDLGANGLRFRRRDNEPFDIVESGGQSVSFDGQWGRGRISEEDYRAAFAAGDERYARMLQALVAQLKR